MQVRPEYNQTPIGLFNSNGIPIASFISENEKNEDKKTVDAFGEEWKKFNAFSDEELADAGNEYFDIVTDKELHKDAVVLDLGCGSGRWSRFIASRCSSIEAVDPSLSVYSAAQLLKEKINVRVTHASVSNIPFADNTFDFLMCLGVLHHIPDTQQALNDAVRKIKPGGHALLYFYYNLENRGWFYRTLFRLSDMKRRFISVMPSGFKRIWCDIIAALVYLPLVLIAKSIKLLFPKQSFWKKIPLSYYANKSFHIMRNDALDRFGTPLEKRYSREEIKSMCAIAGLDVVKFSDDQPYWHLLACKKN